MINADYEKIALESRKGQLIGSGEFQYIVHTLYPFIPLSSIMAWDVCDNIKNKDPQSGKYPLLHFEGQGLGGKFLYKVL